MSGLERPRRVDPQEPINGIVLQEPRTAHAGQPTFFEVVRYFEFCGVVSGISQESIRIVGTGGAKKRLSARLRYTSRLSIWRGAVLQMSKHVQRKALATFVDRILGQHTCVCNMASFLIRKGKEDDGAWFDLI